MTERHTITGPARGETLPADRAGARIRLRLDSAPTPRWSSALAAHLATDLTGCAAVGHLRLNRIVQGAELVLEGVEAGAAERMGSALRGAVAAANGACEGGDAPGPRNMEQDEADRLAIAVGAGARATG